MTPNEERRMRQVAQRLFEAEATIQALLSGQIDAVVDSRNMTPVLLAKAQEALQASEERYRSIVETANEGVWLIDAENKTTFMNLRMAQMLGCEEDMGVGRSPFEFLDEARSELFRSVQLSYQDGEIGYVGCRPAEPAFTRPWIRCCSGKTARVCGPD